MKDSIFQVRCRDCAGIVAKVSMVNGEPVATVEEAGTYFVHKDPDRGIPKGYPTTFNLGEEAKEPTSISVKCRCKVHPFNTSRLVDLYKKQAFGKQLI